MLILPMESYGLPWGCIAVADDIWQAAYMQASWPVRCGMEDFL